MIKHQNEIIARNGLGMGAKNINRELKPTVAKQEAMIALQQKDFHPKPRSRPKKSKP